MLEIDRSATMLFHTMQTKCEGTVAKILAKGVGVDAKGSSEGKEMHMLVSSPEDDALRINCELTGRVR